MRRMAKRLATRYARQRHRAHKGQLDVRKTIRKSMGYGGVPFDIVWKTRDHREAEDRRPSATSRARWRRPRSSCCCSSTASTRWSRGWTPSPSPTGWSGSATSSNDETVDDAIALIIKRIGMRPTDYGRALADFCELQRDELDRHTTVIILGDGRSNYANPRLDLMRDDRRPGAGGDLAQPGAARPTGARATCEMDRLRALLQRGQGLQHAEPAGAHHRGRAADLHAALKRRAPPVARKGWLGAARLLLPSAEPDRSGTASGAMFAET